MEKSLSPQIAYLFWKNDRASIVAIKQLQRFELLKMYIDMNPNEVQEAREVVQKVWDLKDEKKHELCLKAKLKVLLKRLGNSFFSEISLAQVAALEKKLHKDFVNQDFKLKPLVVKLLQEHDFKIVLNAHKVFIALGVLKPEEADSFQKEVEKTKKSYGWADVLSALEEIFLEWAQGTSDHASLFLATVKQRLEVVASRHQTQRMKIHEANNARNAGSRRSRGHDDGSRFNDHYAINNGHFRSHQQALGNYFPSGKGSVPPFPFNGPVPGFPGIPAGKGAALALPPHPFPQH